ncbi:MAG TPA: GNAT family N-acetyltransferase, partial [Haliangium sp.]|nr:GNAT family N-acetyltransferase [Haliangium sp.]
EADGNPTYFVVDLGGRVMGHLGRMPTRFGIEGRPYRASYIHDLFVHPELQRGGRGFFLAMQMYRAAEQASPSFSVLVWTNEINLGLQRARKYDELWVERYVKLLSADGHIDRVTARGGRFGLGVVARAGKPVAAGMLGIADRVLGTALGRRRMQRVDHFDQRFDGLAERLLPRLGIAPIKTRDYLAWKYYDRPHIQSAAYVAMDRAGELLGFTIVTAPGATFHDSYVLELVADPEDTRTIVALAVQAAEHCRSMGAYSLECVAADPRFARVLRQLLFVPREPPYPLFRAGSTRYEHPEVLGRRESWHFSIGDSEGPV